MATFGLKSKQLLQVGLSGDKVMARSGAMVAYEGSVKFEKAVLGGEGLLGALKRKATGEGMSLMTASGKGTVYFAHQASHITVLPLNGGKLFVESSSLIAFDTGLKTSTAFAGLRGAASGQGLFTTTIEGQGSVALTSHGGLLVFEVAAGQPLFVDPDAFIGHQGSLNQEFVFDVNWRTMIGDSSGESYQLKFSGTGKVFVQASELK